MNLHYPDAVVLLHPQKIAVICNDHLGPGMDGTFDDTVIILIILHDVQPDLGTQRTVHAAT